MIEYLNRIYSHTHTTPASAEDIDFEVLDMLRHEDYPQLVFQHIQHENCPFRRDALLERLRRALKDSGMLIDGQLYQLSDDNCLQMIWQNAEDEIKRAIRVCRNQQTTDYTANTHTPPQDASATQTTQTAHNQSATQPIIIHNLTINFYNAPIGQYANNIQQQDYHHGTRQ